MIGAIVLWFHYPDAVTLEVAFTGVSFLRTPGGCDILHFGSCSFSLSHVYICLPVAFVKVIEFQRQFVLKARLRPHLALSRALFPLSLSLSLPVLFSQGLVLVLIKAVSFCLLPAFSTARCELRGNSDTERRGKRW